MGMEQEFKPVKLFCGVIYNDPEGYASARRELQALYSPMDLESEEFTFDFTTYYNTEMGTPLYKRFMAFEALVSPLQLPDIKLLTNRMEIETASDGKRNINIDPGYLSDANVILATTKNHFHRIPLNKGIYAHMEYVIKKKNTLTTLEWTYPDFKSAQYMKFFRELILLYKSGLKALV
ncbi:MAG: DUF4416 family protein [bacterium]|nr:DUF4416 family protein [bacterium]